MMSMKKIKKRGEVEDMRNREKDRKEEKCSLRGDAVKETMNNGRASQVLLIETTVGLYLLLVNAN